MTREDMEQLTSATDVKAEKVCLLFEAGVTRGEIRDFLGVSYQHVQTVLRRRGLAGKAVAGQAGDVDVTVYPVTVGKNGRIELPAAWLAASGVKEGDQLFFRAEDGNLRIMRRREAEQTLLESARKRMPPDQAALLGALFGDPAGSPAD